MTANVGFSTVAMVPAVSGFAPALTGRGGSQFAAPIDRSGFSKIGAGIARTAAPLAVAAAAAWAIGKTVAFVTSSVSQAADLEQSVGAVETVFKGSSDQMLSWSKSAATAVGLTQNEYNELGTLIGTQLKNGGTSMDELAGKTNDLIGVGADLSSMFGGTTADAVDALSSALKGERDPIERYGVSLNQASIDAKAAELGFDKVGGSLSQQANQAATLALIMDQTADAHGNFGKEADTLSHKQQVLNAMWENGKTQIGQAFLPAVSALAGVLISVLGPALDGAVKGVNFVSDAVRFVVGYINGKGADVDLGGWEGAFKNVAIFIQNAIGTIGPVLGQIGAAFAPFIGQIGSAIGQLAPAFAQVLPSISPFAIVLAGLGPILPQIVALVVELATALGPELVAVHALFVPLVAALGDLMRNQLAALLPFLVQAVGIVVGLFAVTGPAFLSFVTAVLPLVSSLVADVLPRLVELVSVLVPVLSAVASLIAAVGPVVGVLLGVLLPMVEGLTPVLQAATALVISVVAAALQVIQGVLLVATGLLSGNWAQVWSGLGTTLSGAWALVTGLVGGALDLAVAAIRAGVTNVGRLFAAAWNGVPALFLAMTDGLRSTVEDGAGAVLDFLDGLGATVRGALSGAGTWLADVGRFIVEGFVDGVKAMTRRIADAVLAPIKDSVDAVKGWLGIHSPSVVMRDHAATAASDAFAAAPDWVSTAEIDRAAPRNLVESIADSLARHDGGEALALDLPSTGSLKGDLDAVEFLLRTQRA